MMIQGTTGGVFTCVVTGDAVRCLSRLCPPTGAGTTIAAVSTPLSLCSSVDSSSAGAGASGHYSIVVLYCAAAAVRTRHHHHIMWLQTNYYIDI